MKVIGHFLVVDQIFVDLPETKPALVDIESIANISEVKLNEKDCRKIYFNNCAPLSISNTMEEIINTLEDAYTDEY